MEEAAQSLNDANVALYAVDARGLIGSLGRVTAVPSAEFRGQPGQGVRTRPSASAGPTHIETMNLLADLTGGDVYFNPARPHGTAIRHAAWR